MPDIEIIVRRPQGSDSESSQQTEQTNEQTVNKKKEPGKPTPQQSAVTAAIINVAQQQLINGVQQYGNLTGNFTNSRAFSNALSAAGDLAIIAKGGIAGAIFVASKNAISLFNSQSDLINKRFEEDFKRERAGMISMKGSRY